MKGRNIWKTPLLGLFQNIKKKVLSNFRHTVNSSIFCWCENFSRNFLIHRKNIFSAALNDIGSLKYVKKIHLKCNSLSIFVFILRLSGLYKRFLFCFKRTCLKTHFYAQQLDFGKIRLF